jgi:uncharacterized protein YkwD
VRRLATLLIATAPVLACALLGAPVAAATAPGAWSKPAPARAASTHASASAKRHAKGRGKSEAASHRKAKGRRASSRHGRGGKARAPHSAATLKRARKSATVVREVDPSRAVTIAKVLATPCQNAQLVPDSSNLPLVREAVLCLVNVERAENGETPLVANAELERAAEGHGQEMISLNYFDHVSPSGLTPVGRIRTTGYLPSDEVGYVIGENLAWGTFGLATAQAIVNAWIASPGHLANILESRYRDTGIGIIPRVPLALAEGAPGALYTQEFGVIVH